MKRKKLHIDQLFKNGLKDFSLFVSNKDMEAIDGKKDIYKSTEEEGNKSSAFSDFELEVGENDWLATKAKLDIEKAAMAQDSVFASGFLDFELPVEPHDWTETYSRYKERKKKRRLLFGWTGTGIALLLIALSALFYTNSKKTKEVAVQNQTVQNQTAMDNTASPENTEKTSAANDSDRPETELPPSKALQSKTSDLPEEVIQPKKIEPDHSKLPNQKKQENPKLASPTAIQDLPEARKPRPLDLGSDFGKKPSNAFAENNKDDNKRPVQEIPVVKQTKATDKMDQNNLTVNPDIIDSPSDNQSSEVKTGTDLDDTKEDVADPVDSTKKDKTVEKNPTKKPSIQFYGGLVTQADMTYRRLSRSNDATYNSIRNNAEKPGFQWTNGFEFGLQKKGVQISTGIQTTTQTWTSNYNYNYRVHDSIPLWNQGHTQILGYFLVRGRDTFINENRVVKIQKIQVPFQMSSLIPLTQNVKLILGGGIVLGWNVKTSGDKLLNPLNNQMYVYNALNDQERSFNVSPNINLGAQFTLSKLFVLQTSLNGGISAYSRFKDGFGAKDYPYSMGLNIKLLYMLQ